MPWLSKKSESSVVWKIIVLKFHQFCMGFFSMVNELNSNLIRSLDIRDSQSMGIIKINLLHSMLWSVLKKPDLKHIKDKINPLNYSIDFFPNKFYLVTVAFIYFDNLFLILVTFILFSSGFFVVNSDLANWSNLFLQSLQSVVFKQVTFIPQWYLNLTFFLDVRQIS